MPNIRPYRGKRIDNGEWVHGCRLDTGYGTFIIPYQEYADRLPQIKVDPETVGQYTGIDSWDGSDNKLFRGDIVSLVDENNETYIAYIDIEGPVVLLVSDHFDDGYEMASEFMESLDGHYWIPGSKKIGNRWDNPELLEGNT